MIHYEGYTLGAFDYDPEEFCIDKDVWGDFLRYIGNETDGSKINIPEGIKNCACMFAGNRNLKTPPVIPISVLSCHFMFSGCTALEEPPVLPDHIISAHSMLSGCDKLNGKTANVPEGIWDIKDLGCDYKEHKRKDTEGLYPIYSLSCHTVYDDSHHVVSRDTSIGVVYNELEMKHVYKKPSECSEFYDNEQGETVSVEYFETKEEAEAAAAAGGDIVEEEEKEM